MREGILFRAGGIKVPARTAVQGRSDGTLNALVWSSGEKSGLVRSFQGS